jgi:hypothetical protein
MLEFSWPKYKYHLVTWSRGQKMWWSGIFNSKKLNIVVMLKSVWKLYQDDNYICVDIIRAKYPSASNIFSHSWSGVPSFGEVWTLNKIKNFFKLGTKHEVRNGQHTLFWFGRWERDGTSQRSFPRTFQHMWLSVCSDFSGWLSQGASVVRFKDISANLPLKIQIFTW